MLSLKCQMNSKPPSMKNKLNMINYGLNNKKNVMKKPLLEKKKLEMPKLPYKKPKKPQMVVILKKLELNPIYKSPKNNQLKTELTYNKLKTPEEEKLMLMKLLLPLSN